MQTRAAWLVLICLVGALTACSTLTGSDEISSLETQNAQYRGTIAMVGTPQMTITALGQFAAENIVLKAQLNHATETMTVMELELRALRSEVSLTQVAAGGSPLVPQQPNNSLGAPAVTPNSVNPQPTKAPLATTDPQVTAAPAITPPANTTTRFTQTVTATGRDANDCAQGVTAIFEPTTPTIYVVTRINELPARSVIGARWTANGNLYFDDVECWIPQQNYVDICAYCSIVPDGTAFEAGEWSVEMLFNQQVLTQVQFQVRDPNAEADQMSDSTSGDSDWKGNN